jgi:tetratricopeptide (TPR) repeat protein
MSFKKMHNNLSSSPAAVLNKIQILLEERDYLNATNIASKYIKKYPNIQGFKKALAFCYGATGNLYGSKKLWMELININPYDEEILINLADIELRLGRVDSSLGLMKLASEYHPTSIKSWLNMAGAYLLKGEFQNALDVSLQAVNIDPKNADGFQNLGSSLFNLGMFKEARHAFETALLLNPNLQEAKSSLSMVFAKQNEFLISAEILDNLILNSKKTDRIPIEQLKWDAALIHLRLGNLSTGFEYYEYGFHPEVRGHLIRKPHRSFKVDKWTPDMPKNQPVLVWREQGIGDEILFMTCLHDLIKSGYEPIIETDKRLISIYQRSFPNVVVREALFNNAYPHDSPYEDFGSHIPMGSLMKAYRNTIDSFPNSAGYLVPDHLLVAKWRDRLKELRRPNKKIIGLSWKGGISDPLRNSKYTKLIDWSYLLSNPNFEFINFQYGDCLNEIREVEAILGIKIHRWDDLNLKQDIEDIYGLLANIDQLITVSTAVWMFSASIGTPTTLLLHTNHWTMFDQNFIPFFPNVKCLVAGNNESIPELLPQAVLSFQST